MEWDNALAATRVLQELRQCIFILGGESNTVSINWIECFKSVSNERVAHLGVRSKIADPRKAVDLHNGPVY